MSEPEILTEITRILRHEVGISAEITPALDLQRDLALDSLSLMTLTVALEDRFRIIFREEDAPGIRTVADVASYIARRVEESC